MTSVPETCENCPCWKEMWWRFTQRWVRMAGGGEKWMAGWAGFHPHMWKRMNKFQSSIAPCTRNLGERINRACTALWINWSVLKAVFLAVQHPPSYILLPSLNAGISKDVGTDGLMACLEPCKKQPARLSLSGTRARPKAFLPKRACKHVSSGFFLTSIASDILMPATSKCLMHSCFIFMCHSPEFLMVQRIRGLILLFPALKKKKKECCHLGKIQRYLS